jgi:hypothetical protein
MLEADQQSFQIDTEARPRHLYTQVQSFIQGRATKGRLVQVGQRFLNCG